VAIEGFAGDPHNIEKSPPGAEGDGELPLRVEGLVLVSLFSVDGTAGSSLGGTDEGISEAAVVAIEGFVNDSNNIKDSPPGAEGDGEVPLRAEGLGLVPLSSVDGMAGDFPEADEGLWGKCVTHNGEPNREAESSGPSFSGVGAASGSGDDRPSACSRAPRRARTPPDRDDPRYLVSKASMRACMPPGSGDANQAISRAKIRDTGSADTGSADTGSAETGSADAGSAGYNGAGGATGGGEGVSAKDSAGGAVTGSTGDGGSAFPAKRTSSPNEAVLSPERDASSSSLSSSSSY
jgi:hypothetical protein